MIFQLWHNSAHIIVVPLQPSEQIVVSVVIFSQVTFNLLSEFGNLGSVLLRYRSFIGIVRHFGDLFRGFGCLEYPSRNVSFKKDLWCEIGSDQ